MNPQDSLTGIDVKVDSEDALTFLEWCWKWLELHPELLYGLGWALVFFIVCLGLGVIIRAFRGRK